MLLVLCSAGEERYGIPAQHIVEVLPRLELKSFSQLPDYVPGVFQYRSGVVAVVDLRYLLQRQTALAYVSTRIIVLRSPLEVSGPMPGPVGLGPGSGPSAQDGAKPLPGVIGLMAERVTEARGSEELESIGEGRSLNRLPYLGELWSDGQGLIQRLDVARFWQTVVDPLWV